MRKPRGHRAPNITDDHTVPQQLLSVVTHVVATMDRELRSKATEEQRAAAAKTITEQREAQKKRDEGKAPRYGEA